MLGRIRRDGRVVQAHSNSGFRWQLEVAVLRLPVFIDELGFLLSVIAVPFKDGEVMSLTTNTSEEGEGWTMSFTEVPADAAEKYNKALKSAGFTTQTVMVNDQGGSVTAEKGNIAVFLMAAEGSASLSVQVEAE